MAPRRQMSTPPHPQNMSQLDRFHACNSVTSSRLSDTMALKRLRGKIFDVKNIAQLLGVADWDRVYHAGKWYAFYPNRYSWRFRGIFRNRPIRRSIRVFHRFFVRRAPDPPHDPARGA